MKLGAAQTSHRSGGVRLLGYTSIAAEMGGCRSQGLVEHIAAESLPWWKIRYPQPQGIH